METANRIYEKSCKSFERGYTVSYEHVNFINRIDGINVIVFVGTSIKKMTLIIAFGRTLNILFKSDLEFNSKTINYSVESIYTHINKFKQILDSLVFNSELGIFVSNFEKQSFPLFYDVFGLNFIDSSNCVGCGTKTITKLKCEHYCCIKCFYLFGTTTNSACATCGNAIKKNSILKNNIQCYELKDGEVNYLIKIIRKINSNSVMRLGLSVEHKYTEESEEQDDEDDDENGWEDDEDDDEDDEDDEDEDE